VAPLVELIHRVSHVKCNRRPVDFSVKSNLYSLVGEGDSAACRLIHLMEVIPRVGPDKGTWRPAETTMEPESEEHRNS
jgi:hypothetical protein